MMGSSDLLVHRINLAGEVTCSLDLRHSLSLMKQFISLDNLFDHQLTSKGGVSNHLPGKLFKYKRTIGCDNFGAPRKGFYLLNSPVRYDKQKNISLFLAAKCSTINQYVSLSVAAYGQFAPCFSININNNISPNVYIPSVYI